MSLNSGCQANWIGILQIPISRMTLPQSKKIYEPVVQYHPPTPTRCSVSPITNSCIRRWHATIVFSRRTRKLGQIQWLHERPFHSNRRRMASAINSSSVMKTFFAIPSDYLPVQVQTPISILIWIKIRGFKP